MSEEEIKQLIAKIEDHEKRIAALEGGASREVSEPSTPSKKMMTLPEFIRGKKFKSGQEKVAVIVGYLEKISHCEKIVEADIKKGWKDGKFDGKYNPCLLSRAIGDGLVRKIDGNLDLSQTGESFFNSFANPNVN